MDRTSSPTPSLNQEDLDAIVGGATANTVNAVAAANLVSLQSMQVVKTDPALSVEALRLHKR